MDVSTWKVVPKTGEDTPETIGLDMFQVVNESDPPKGMALGLRADCIKILNPGQRQAVLQLSTPVEVS